MGYPENKKSLFGNAIDQAHEQNNAIVKGSGGAIGLMQNPVAFRKWLLAGPEQGWLIEEFEKQFLESKDDDNFHHDEGYSTQTNFKSLGGSI